MRQYTIGKFCPYWAEMGDEAVAAGENQFLQGYLVEIGERDQDGYRRMIVRSSVTNRLYDVLIDEDGLWGNPGVTIECTKHAV